jgi:hypothetical protein
VPRPHTSRVCIGHTLTRLETGTPNHVGVVEAPVLVVIGLETYPAGTSLDGAAGRGYASLKVKAFRTGYLPHARNAPKHSASHTLYRPVPVNALLFLQYRPSARRAAIAP